ncbi:TPA: hypothetical protein DIC21_02805 [Candidatus Uhrbacteria bacterium]|nr:hypothetical protein [Candidatus Uhrbacteria bacterium]
MDRKKNQRKHFASWLMALMVLFLLLPTWFLGPEAHAGNRKFFSSPEFLVRLGLEQATAAACVNKMPPDPACAQESISEAYDLTFGELIGPMLKATAMTVLVDSFQYVLDTLAYQSAVWITTGGSGESPLFETSSAPDAWNKFGLDVAANAVGSLSDGLQDYLDVEFNLCAPPNPVFRAGLALGIKSTYRPTAPKCDWQSIQSNWEGFVQTIEQTSASPTEAILNEVAKGLRPGQNSLSYFVEANIKVNEKTLEKKQNLWSDFLANKRFKDVSDFVTGTVETPAEVVSGSFQAQLQFTKEGKLDKAMDAAVADSDILLMMLKQTTSVFLTTLISKGVDRFIQNGLYKSDSEEADPFDDESSSSFGRSQAEEFFSDLISTTPMSLDNYSILTQFTTCTSGTSLVRQANNCVMDLSMFGVVTRSSAGEGITVGQAMADGKLFGDWALYSPNDLTHNQDPNCYTYGYCYGNLVKLRKARILPIGWEIAAASEQNSVSSPITLQEVVAGFNDCNSDNKLDAEHPWCHLIDPNWIIKYPEQRCDASMIGEQLISADLAGRSGSCVDDPSCVGEDADGNCLGYGYCVREKNTWDFNGDACPADYATCMSFTNSETSVKSNWLLNTLDQGICSSANAGCLWYRTNKYATNAGTVTDTSDDTYEWLPTNDLYLTAGRENDVLSFDSSGTPTARTTYDYDVDGDGVEEGSYNVYSFEDRIYLNSEVEYCSEETVGCSKVYPVNDSLSLNLIRNASFEDDEDDNGAADFWTTTATDDFIYDESGSYAFSGTDSYYLDGPELNQSQIRLQPNRFYTLSFYAQGSASDSMATLSLELKDSSNTSVVLTGYSTDCSLSGTDTVTLSSNSSLGTSSFASYDCTFTTPSLSDSRDWIVGALTIKSTATIYIDAIQLEVGEVPSDFHEDYSDVSPAVEYLQLAPAWLGCEGKATDPADCDNYTQVCSATEVGCSLYTPVDGDPSVPAIISETDQCPSECVGYATYKQESTDYDAEEFPLYFISDSANTCSSAYVGCDEFTNLETEEIETYSYLRACVTPEMNAGEVFFTWEGSDAAGYQLVSYLLLSSQLAVNDTVGYTEGTASVSDDTSAGNAPCTSWEVSSVNDLICTDDLDVLKIIDECNEHADILTNPDCREFYDSLGVIHYRLFSETVSVSDDCTAYRKTEIDATDCAYSGGFMTAAGECRYYLEPNESTVCPVAMAGCREYTGGSSRNSSSILTEYFEYGTYDGYTSTDASLAISNESVAVDGHSLKVTTTSSNSRVIVAPDNIVAGKTYVLKFWASGTGSVRPSLVDNGGDDDAHFFSDEVTELSSSWQLYEIGPIETTGSDFAIFDETAVLAFDFSASGQVVYLDNIELVQTEEDLTLIKDSWVTPSTCDETAAGASSPQYYLGCEEYADQNDTTYYLYQFSGLCSESVVGCEAFFDTQNSTSSYTQVFNATCYNPIDTDGDGIYAYTALDIAEDVLSSATACEVSGEEVCTIIAGRNNCQFNSDSNLPTPLPTNVVFGPETVYVPTDEVVYLVSSSDYSCTSENMGCTEVGLPVFSQDKSVVTAFESTYILNQPDSYDSTLCSDESLFCAEWASTSDGNYYFKDPGEQSCEYKTGVSLNNISYSGWFRSGTTQFCYGTGYCSEDTGVACTNDAACALGGDGTCVINFGSYIKNGNVSGLWFNGDTNYTGWAGSCSSSYDQCSEFIEPLATEEGNSAEGTSYFFLDNSSIAEEKKNTTDRCDGQMSLLDGCVLFNDTMDTNLAYSASASYMASEHADILFGEEPRSMQDPVSCPGGGDFSLTTGGTVDLCANRCYYELTTGSEITNLWGEVVASAFLSSSCVSDNDCQTGLDQYNREIAGTCLNLETSDLDVYALENDTNRVIKVYRDRQCAEWLACDDSQSAWDEKTNSWVNVCQGIGLCNEFSSGGNDNFCSGWVQEQPVILDADKYSSRDVSWYGLDYSGYAIPNLLPAQFLDQYNIAPMGYCYNAGSIVEPSVACDTGSDCRGIGAAAYCVLAEDLPEDYSFDSNQWYLVYLASTCDETDGEACTAGFCTDTGNACTEDGDCPDGECIIGYCEAAWPDSYCTSDDDCLAYDSTGGLTCENGSCVEVIYETDGSGAQETCVADSDCGSSSLGLSAECIPAALAKTGTCYNNICLVDRDGQPFNPTYAEDKTCRGYPEIDSPFLASKIVDNWLNPSDYLSFTSADENPETADSVPYDFVYGFRDTPTCALTEVTPGVCNSGGEECFSDADCPTGESCEGAILEESADCLCSYEKAKYGSGAIKRYYPLDTERDEVLTGVCSGGSTPGLECETDADCTVDESLSGGTCEKLNRLDTVYGWDGYCLERDVSTQLFGSTDSMDRTCLTWLPIDKLNGSRDAYANDTDAGYNAGDTYYCAEIEEAYNIGTTDKGCAEGYGACQDGGWSEFTARMCEDGDCLGSVVCPEGFFAVMGGCEDLESEGGFASICEDDGDKDCPFFCVPKASYKTESDGDGQIGDPCLAPGTSDNVPDLINEASSCDESPGVYVATSIASSMRGGSLESGQNFYIYIPSGNFQEVIDFYDDCEVDGVLAGAGLDAYISPYPEISEIPVQESGIHGFDGLNYNIGTYAACTSVVQVASNISDPNSGNYNQAWTNRVWTQNPSLYSLAGSSSMYLGYTTNTSPTIFGQAVDPNTMNGLPDPYPHHVGVCTDLDPEIQGFSVSTPEIIVNMSTDGTCSSEDLFVSYTGDLLEAMPLSTILGISGGDSGEVESSDALGIFCEDRDGDGDSDCDGCTSDAECNFGVTCDWDGSAAEGTCIGGEKNGAPCINDENCYFMECIREEDVEMATVTTFCNYGGSVTTTLAVDDYNNARNLLKQIFAESYSLWSFDDGYDNIDSFSVDGVTSEWLGSKGGFTEDTLTAADSWIWNDVTASGDDYGERFNDGDPTPPTIASVGLCYGSDCLEQNEGKFSVNGYDSDTLEAEGGSYHAIVNFFAWANNNQMPLRDVTVDWGDDHDNPRYTDYAWPLGSQSGTVGDETSYYKNRRGLIDRNNSYCLSAADEFGLSSSACLTAYFSFAHDYTCSRGLAGDGITTAASLPLCQYADETSGRLLNSPCTGGVIDDADNKCVFQPRVHVKDNWGWCTGYCDSNYNGSDSADDTTSCYGNYECAVGQCPSTQDADGDGLFDEFEVDCADRYGGTSSNPWINYDGVIILDWSTE